MTFRVADLMLEPVVMAPGKKRSPKPDKDKPKKVCGRCTVNTACGHCSQCTECTVCTGCSACTCTRCTLTAASTCTGDTDLQDCSCSIRAERNLDALKAALRSKVEAVVAVA